MSDFEIISVVIMTISLVLKAIKFGCVGNDKKKKKKSKAAIQLALVTPFSLL